MPSTSTKATAPYRYFRQFPIIKFSILSPFMFDFIDKMKEYQTLIHLYKVNFNKEGEVRC